MKNEKDNTKKVRRVFLIGNGCFSNGDKPIIRALKFSEDLNSNYFLPDATKIGHMHALSCLAAEERAWFVILAQAVKRKWNPPELINGEDSSILLIQHLSKAASFRKILGQSYNEDDEIKWKKTCHDFLVGEGSVLDKK